MKSKNIIFLIFLILIAPCILFGKLNFGLTNAVKNTGEKLDKKVENKNNLITKELIFIEKVWAKVWGSENIEWGKDVSVDNFGNIYVTGLTKGSIDGNIYGGGDDFFLTKFNSSGDRLWTKQLGIVNHDWGEALCNDYLGNIYVTGHIPTETPNGGAIFLSKFDSYGNQLWTQKWGDSFFYTGYDVIVDSSNNVYVTGEKGSMFLAKCDSLGNVLWSVSNSSGTASYSVTIDTSANVYIAGTTGGADSDIIIAKYDYLGNSIWTKRLGTMHYDVAYGIVADNLGNIYVAGLTDGNLAGNKISDGTDIFLIKFDSDGNILFKKQWRPLGVENRGIGYKLKIKLDSSNNIYLITSSTLIKCNAVGDKLWDTKVYVNRGGTIDNSGNIYITGMCESSIDGNPYLGYGDVFLIKYREIK